MISRYVSLLAIFALIPQSLIKRMEKGNISAATTWDFQSTYWTYMIMMNDIQSSAMVRNSVDVAVIMFSRRQQEEWIVSHVNTAEEHERERRGQGDSCT